MNVGSDVSDDFGYCTKKNLDIFDSCTFRYGMNHQNLGNGSSFRLFFRKLRPVTGW